MIKIKEKQSCENIYIYKSPSINIYIDNNVNKGSDKILNIDINKTSSDKKLFSEFSEYFTSFWVITKNENSKYHMIINIKDTSIIPVSFVSQIYNMLNQLESIFKTNLHSTCILSKKSTSIHFIKPILNAYKPSRPLKFTNTYEECKQFFINPKNILHI
jgi:hypothetical protein